MARRDTGYDPKAVGGDTDIKVLYVTPASDSAAFPKAYPSLQTDVELSPSGDTCNAGDLSTSTWS